MQLKLSEQLEAKQVQWNVESQCPILLPKCLRRPTAITPLSSLCCWMALCLAATSGRDTTTEQDSGCSLGRYQWPEEIWTIPRMSSAEGRMLRWCCLLLPRAIHPCRQRWASTNAGEQVPISHAWAARQGKVQHCNTALRTALQVGTTNNGTQQHFVWVLSD